MPSSFIEASLGRPSRWSRDWNFAVRLGQSIPIVKSLPSLVRIVRHEPAKDALIAATFKSASALKSEAKDVEDCRELFDRMITELERVTWSSGFVRCLRQNKASGLSVVCTSGERLRGAAAEKSYREIRIIDGSDL